MGIQIKRVAVLGAGVMGQGIAAHLANAGIPSYLFDIAPNELTEAEENKGLTLEDRAVRNRYSDAGIATLLKARPAVIYRKDLAKLITPCNYVDDVEKLAECDWIVEVVLERMDIKKKVFDMVEEHRKPGSIISSNTSGLSVAEMAEGRSDDFRKHFLVTHFFNPVRYLRLLELVPCVDTDPAIYEAVADFGENVLGKGIVHGKDTPNFVANRIGVFGIMSTIHWMQEMGLSTTLIDKVFGPNMGRAKSAVFRTADIVGVDTLAHVIQTVYDGCADDPWRERFQVPGFMKQMVEQGLIGQKAKAGFYKKSKDDQGKKQILQLNLESLEYEPQPKVRLDSIGLARDKDDVAGKVNAMVWAKDPGGQIAWKVSAETCLYSAQLLGEIADDVVNIDRGVRWGFNYEGGPFESWDAMGVERSVARMKEEGMEVPACVETLLEKGEGSWYVKKDGVQHYWDVIDETYKPVPIAERLIFLPSLYERNKVLDKNMSASLLDMGDGVGCLEFHAKMNAIDPDIIAMLHKSADMLEAGELAGLVIGNEAPNFCVGANVAAVLMAAMMKQFDQIEKLIDELQQGMMRLKYAPAPVVTAPRGMALGGGAEIMMQGDKVRAAAETYIGQVELGVGFIPAGGGCKELAFRYYGSAPKGVNVELFPFMQRIFEIIGMAQVATSAEEGREMGFLRETDAVTLNPDAVLADAKADVLAMLSTGYKPPIPKTVPVPGSDGIAALNIGIHTMVEGKFITEYEGFMGRKLAHVICGGDVPAGTQRTEQDFLDLEREAFVSLAGEKKTQERIQHMLEKGKPLRN